MKTSRIQSLRFRKTEQSGSTFIIVLWIAFGLVSVALYFGYAMSYELRASDNRVSGQAAEQAIEGAVRYVNSLLAYQSSINSNGILPDVASYLAEDVPVGDARFWLIGRDTNTLSGPGELAFGLVDESSKINLNTVSSNMLATLVNSFPNANQDLAAAVLDWRNTNAPAVFQPYYSTGGQSYQTKSSPFETVDELRLVYGGDLDTLVGEDANRNGVLDSNENDVSHDGQLEPGLLEYVTVYSREPNTYSNGVPRINLLAVPSNSRPLRTLLEATFGSDQAGRILRYTTNAAACRSPLSFYIAGRSAMTTDDFARIVNCISTTATTNNFIAGRININTASATVLACLPGFDAAPDAAQAVVNYRQTNPDKLTSVAWIVEALGQNTNSVLPILRTNDCITTQSFQVSADVAAVGPNGRGYRRARFVFDTSDGTPKVVYRQDLTHLGWALGKQIRDTVVLAKATR